MAITPEGVKNLAKKFEENPTIKFGVTTHNLRLLFRQKIKFEEPSVQAEFDTYQRDLLPVLERLSPKYKVYIGANLIPMLQGYKPEAANTDTKANKPKTDPKP